MISDREKILMQMLRELLDYATCMKCATGYTTGSEPNIGHMTRYINQIHKEVENDRKLQKYPGNDQNQ